MASVSHLESFRIPHNHPCLAGHFPGNPVVPGVVVLDRIADAVARHSGRHLAALAQVKFLAPLLPEQEAQLQLEHSDDRLRFRVLRGDDLIASGEASLA